MAIAISLQASAGIRPTSALAVPLIPGLSALRAATELCYVGKVSKKGNT